MKAGFEPAVRIVDLAGQLGTGGRGEASRAAASSGRPGKAPRTELTVSIRCRRAVSVSMNLAYGV